MPRDADFDLRALYEALDAKRRERGLTWAAVAAEINRSHAGARPVASSTITGIKDKAVVEGDGVLQMLLWLGRSPESFVPGVADADDPKFNLPSVTARQILRWNALALHAALDRQRQERQLTWSAVAREIGGVTPAMLTRLRDGGRLTLPHVMRMVRWLGEPAVTFTHIANR